MFPFHIVETEEIEMPASETRPSFGGNADPAPKVPFTGPRSGRAAGPWKGPKVVMRWGKVTRSYREPVVLTEAERAEKRSYRLSQGGW